MPRHTQHHACHRRRAPSHASSCVPTLPFPRMPLCVCVCAGAAGRWPPALLALVGSAALAVCGSRPRRLPVALLLCRLLPVCSAALWSGARIRRQARALHQHAACQNFKLGAPGKIRVIVSVVVKEGGKGLLDVWTGGGQKPGGKFVGKVGGKGGGGAEALPPARWMRPGP
eukprot:363567-Chlamydomonas_euryale.AAC.1